MVVLRTRNAEETKRAAIALARSVRAPRVVALVGQLGSGKTTFAQGFARALGIKKKIQSPTFVLMREHKIKAGHFFHIDCYRLDSARNLAHLGFKNLLKDKNAIVLIEWADRVKKFIPKSALWIKFRHGQKPHERIIKIL